MVMRILSFIKGWERDDVVTLCVVFLSLSQLVLSVGYGT